ncbi:hypothetical protein VCHA53O466_40257 [Vibrio chagasii]|nr:hypothetical protein VCHA53O466_40257 [Vibrio chagasii]
MTIQGKAREINFELKFAPTSFEMCVQAGFPLKVLMNIAEEIESDIENETVSYKHNLEQVKAWREDLSDR